MNSPSPDLTREFPRSPQEKLGPYVHLARMIDKVRAREAGTLGEYIYPCPLDQSLLEFLGLSGEMFQEAVRGRTDSEILDWLKIKAAPRPPKQIDDWNAAFLNRKPRNEESLRRFMEIRGRLAPHRSDITAWPDLLDLEEGRKVPLRTPD